MTFCTYLKKNRCSFRLCSEQRLKSFAIIAVFFSAGVAQADDQRQSLNDFWVTGSLYSSTAATLPAGSAFFEPYWWNVMSYGAYSAKGQHQAGPVVNHVRSFNPFYYGLTSNLMVGVKATFGYNSSRAFAPSGGVHVGDVALKMQYRIWHPPKESSWPTVSLDFQETIPVERIDHLSESANPIGSGVFSEQLSVFAQSYMWLPNGRVDRLRLNYSYVVPTGRHLKGRSVYGTLPGFDGHVSVGQGSVFNLSNEYSITKHWVFATDFIVSQSDAVRVHGWSKGGGLFQDNAPASYSLMIAPALEYNITGMVGVIAGAGITFQGRNAAASVTPMMAVNWSF